MSLPTSRKEALANGSVWYITGKPCKQGHYAKRKASNGGCYECGVNLLREWRSKNPDKVASALKRQYARNPGMFKRNAAAWNRKNKHCVLANLRKRQIGKKHRTPGWLTKDEQRQIRELYRTAADLTKRTGVPWHVDHVFPLHGKTVSGLHTLSNLRVILASENMSKGNRV